MAFLTGEPGVSASFDNDPSATESEHSFAIALLYFLAGEPGDCPAAGAVDRALRDCVDVLAGGVTVRAGSLHARIAPITRAKHNA